MRERERERGGGGVKKKEGGGRERGKTHSKAEAAGSFVLLALDCACLARTLLIHNRLGAIGT